MTTKPFALFAAAAIALCTLYACSKKSATSPKLSGATLPGTWEIRGMWGPLIDVNPDAFKPGNGNTWSFSQSQFEQRSKDSVYKTGTYTVNHTGLNPVDNRQVQRFVFNGVAAESFELRNDSLFVYSTRTDDYQSTSVYVKISYSY